MCSIHKLYDLKKYMSIADISDHYIQEFKLNFSTTNSNQKQILKFYHFFKYTLKKISTIFYLNLSNCNYFINIMSLHKCKQKLNYFLPMSERKMKFKTRSSLLKQVLVITSNF